VTWASRAVVAVAAVAVTACPRPLSAAGPSADEIAAWISQLGAPQFARREAASRSLLAAGQPAVEPLARAIQGSDLEVASRGIEILRDMLDEPSVAPAAEAALERCAEEAAAAARIAESVLAFHRQGRTAAARSRLESLGAVIHERPAAVMAGLEVELGRGWKGTGDDLRELTRLPRLEGLAFHGVPLGERDLAVVARLHGLRRVELFGTGLSDQAVATLAAKLPDAQIEVRRGGKLGVGALAFGGRCEIQTVEPGSAADQAGVRPGDVIVAVDGAPVADFDALTARMAGRGPGERVRLSVARGDRQPDGDAERLELDVRLDAW